MTLDRLYEVKPQVVPVSEGLNKPYLGLLSSREVQIFQGAHNTLQDLLSRRIEGSQFRDISYKFKPVLETGGGSNFDDSISPLGVFMAAIYNTALSVNRGDINRGKSAEDIARVRGETVAGLSGLLDAVNCIVVGNIILGDFKVRVNRNHEEQGLMSADLGQERPLIEAVYNPWRKRLGLTYNEAHPGRAISFDHLDQTLGATATILIDQTDERNGVLKLELDAHRRRWRRGREGLVNDRIEEHLMDSILGFGRKMIILATGDYRQIIRWERTLMDQLHIKELLPNNQR